jgi:glycosyltransferase involved in cell wall biosynthesis
MSGPALVHAAKVAGISGSEAHLLSLLPALRERGWDLRFLMLHEEEPGAWEFAARLDDAGIPVRGIRIKRDVDPLAFGRLHGAIARERPTILHTHLVHADIYGLVAGAAARVPILFSTKHGFNEFRERSSFALADRSVARLATTHIAISDGLARYLAETEGFDRQAFEIVHYGIEPGAQSRAYEGVAPVVLCIGRLIPIKGHIVLLRALALAVREVPELELRIAGRGPLEPALRALVHELGISGSVRFLGQVTPIQPAIEDALGVVVPSLGEGFGMVALEAMERERPVVAAAIGGLSEIVVDGETGFLVEPADAETLAAALVRLVGDPAAAAAMGAAGRRRALASFRQVRCTERTEELYREALASVSS